MDPVWSSRRIVPHGLTYTTHTHTHRYTYTRIITSTHHTYTKATLSEEVQSWLEHFLLKVVLEDAEFPDLEDATSDNSMHNTHIIK